MDERARLLQEQLKAQLTQKSPADELIPDPANFQQQTTGYTDLVSAPDQLQPTQQEPPLTYAQTPDYIPVTPSARSSAMSGQSVDSSFNAELKNNMIAKKQQEREAILNKIRAAQFKNDPDAVLSESANLEQIDKQIQKIQTTEVVKTPEQIKAEQAQQKMVMANEKLKNLGLEQFKTQEQEIADKQASVAKAAIEAEALKELNKADQTAEIEEQNKKIMVAAQQSNALKVSSRDLYSPKYVQRDTVDTDDTYRAKVEKNQQDYERFIQTSEIERNKLDKALENLTKQTKIDPNRVLGSTRGKIMGTLAIALGGFGQALRGGDNNAGYDALMTVIDRDIDAQKTNSANAMNEFRLLADTLNSRQQAEGLMRLNMLNFAMDNLKTAENTRNQNRDYELRRAETLQNLQLTKVQVQKTMLDMMASSAQLQALNQSMGSGVAGSGIKDPFVFSPDDIKTKSERAIYVNTKDGDLTPLGFASDVNSAKELKKKLKGYQGLKSQLSRLSEIYEMGAASRTLDPVLSAEASAISAAILPTLRIDYTGGGNMTDDERKYILNTIIPAGAKFGSPGSLDVFGREKSKLDQMMNRMENAMASDFSSAGIAYNQYRDKLNEDLEHRKRTFRPDLKNKVRDEDIQNELKFLNDRKIRAKVSEYKR